MIIKTADRLESKVSTALASFEESFTYPLGEQTFTISHGEDYLRFFRDLGETTCFVAQEDGQVQGAFTTVKRTLVGKDGTSSPVVYLCDFKVVPKSHPSHFFKLCRAALSHYQGQVVSAYGVVMEGSSRTPNQYTGAWGIPRLTELAKFAILRIPVQAFEGRNHNQVPVKQALAMFKKLNTCDFYLAREKEKTGSRFTPVGLVTAEDRACGILEDTLNSKVLISNGKELVSGHLSNFCYQTPQDGIELIRSALGLCSERGLPALFVSIPISDIASFTANDELPQSTTTTASVFGLGLPEQKTWSINTSEV